MAVKQMTISLPEDVARRVLRFPNPEAFITEAVKKAIDRVSKPKAAQASPPSRWAQLVERIEADPVHLDGYSEQLKRDIREFREGFEFKSDRRS